MVKTSPFLLTLALASTGLSLLASCARPGRPPGGPEDRAPPMVVSTWPDTFQRIEPTQDPAVIRFNERISESPVGGTLQDAVLVSPLTGDYEVGHSRAGLEISLPGGFREGLVYRIRVLPTVKDMFGNTMVEPFELVFSTGGAFEDNVLAGEVQDRITLQPVDGARVEAWPAPGDEERGEEGTEAREAAAGEERAREEGQGTRRQRAAVRPVYVSRTDQDGIFVLRYLPSGSYDVTVYQDVNRNGEPNFTESQGDTAVTVRTTETGTDTVIASLTLLQPDTTPSELIRVDAQDSLTLFLAFSDYMDTGSPLTGVEVALRRATEEGERGEPGPEVDRLLWEFQLDSLRAHADSVRAADSARAVADSLRTVLDSLETVLASLQAVAADTTRVDSITTRMEALREELEPPEAEEDPPEEERAPEAEPEPEPEPILPETHFFALLAEPMAPGVLYRVTVTGVENLVGLGGGGGEAGVTWNPPDTATADTVAADSAAAAPDTMAAPPDSVAPPDTTATPPDTTAVPPDTSTVSPDSTAPPPDTTGALSDTTEAPPDNAAAPPDTTGTPPDTTVHFRDGTAVPPDTGLSLFHGLVPRAALLQRGTL